MRQKREDVFHFDVTFPRSILADVALCASSLGQCGRSVHVGGGEVHRQHHEGLLRRGRHRSLNGGVRRLVWTTDKYVTFSSPHCR